MNARSPVGSPAPPTVAPAASRRTAFVDGAIAALYVVAFVGYPLSVVGVSRKLLYLPALARQPGAFDWSIEFVSLLSIGMVMTCAAALAVRRSRPRASFLAISAVGAVQLVVGEPISFWNVAMLAALFSAAAYTDRGFGRLALGVGAAAYLGIWVQATGLLNSLPHLPNVLDVLTSARGAAFVAIFGLLLFIWSLGDQVRAGRERFAFVQDRAAQLERDRDRSMQMAALAERQRIARELHDVVAHGLSVMIVQSDGALYAAAEHPDAPREALAAIAATGRESLAEMRRLLGVLREDGNAAALVPQPDLSAIPDLVEQFRHAGLTIAMTTDGSARAVPPGVGLAVYRVVQESLTNVLKHAGHADVRLTLAFLPGQIGVHIANGPGDLPATERSVAPGLGLTGMGERIGLLNGRMSAGAIQSGGFAVQVEIPDGSFDANGSERPPRTMGRAIGPA